VLFLGNAFLESEAAELKKWGIIKPKKQKKEQLR